LRLQPAVPWQCHDNAFSLCKTILCMT
jgi:hypothetical protein